MQPLYKIKTLIKELPGKDAALASKFLERRNFQGILELTDSDIYKARKQATENTELDNHIDNLIELKCALEEYMSYLEPLEDNDYFSEYI